ncbi:MAG: hypothetical protein AAGG09_06660 [Pseudomonadota bacterium]
MEAFTHFRPEARDALQRLRATDPVFDEIVRDYETLAGLLPRDASDPALADIKHSLAALEREIQAHISRCAAGPGASDPGASTR